MKNKNKNHIVHTPVLLEEVMQLLNPTDGESYLDLTAGYAGHASSIVEATHCPDKAVLCDRDPEAINHIREHLPQATRIHKNFYDACLELVEKNSSFDMILADLGVSSPHLDKANRGFSILHDGPLDMRMDQSQGRTAGDIVNTASEKELETILRVYGEEPKARRIAQQIVMQRPLNTTHELAELIKRVYGGRSKHHPAVKSFQALRIEVNDELGLLTRMLPLATQLLKPGGRLAIITFHSLEDRIVKQYFNDSASWGYESEIALLTKKPIIPSPHDIRFNPRSRSAKLRGVVKNKQKGQETL